MNDIRRVLRVAAIRLFVTEALAHLAIVLTIALSALILTRLVERVFGLELPWNQIWLGSGIATLVATLLWTAISRARGVRVAIALDERANLREALSTALVYEKSTDPWCLAVIEDATQKARTVKVREVIPIAAPKRWPVPAATALAFMIIWMSVPSMDVLGLLAAKEEEAQKEQRLVEVKAAEKESLQKIEEMLAKANPKLALELGDKEGEERKAQATTPEEAARAAVKKLTAITEKLEAEKNNEKAQQLDAVREAMRQLKQPGDGPLQELARQMARGDFSKATEALEDLKKKIETGDLKPEEREALKKQAENLSKQLEKLSQENKGLEQALQQAGIDSKQAKELAKQAAGDPQKLQEAMQKAMEQMKNMSPEQKKQLLEKALSMCESMGQCNKMSEQMGKMAQSMSSQGMGQQGQESMESMSQMLSELEQMQQEGQSMEAALNEAKKRLSEMAGQCEGGEGDGGDMASFKPGNGKWREGDTSKMGNGSGGPGQGNGASPEATPADFKLEKRKEQVATGEGPIISSRKTWGELIKGSSTAEFAEAQAQAVAQAAEDLETMTVPREYSDAVRGYFGTVENAKKKANDKPASAPTPSPAPAPKP